MRELNIGSKNFTKLFAEDEPGHGGACHNYAIKRAQVNEEIAYVCFQNGPIKEYGVNGCQNEDLLAIVIDRLESFQAGSFACRENALALAKIEEAMHWLKHRTSDRQAQGVEGRSWHRRKECKSPTWKEEVSSSVRFIRLDDCYQDQKTGLEWSLNNLGPMCWNEAIKVHKSLAGWRLPTIEELATLIDYGTPGRVTSLPDMHLDHYWSSSPNARDSDYAWYVHFHYGNVNYDSKTYHDYVRCVRTSDTKERKDE